MKIYFISGLGADERVFQFLDLPGVECVFIKWINPSPRESLSAYAGRLTAQIDQSEDIILAGISFGGIIAQEISKLIACKKVIIISSVKSRGEFSWQMSLAVRTRIYKLFPASFLKWSNSLTADYYFSTATKKDSILLHQIIEDTDNTFMVWAINAIMTWKNEAVQKDIVHIHGTADRIFPHKHITGYIGIKDGGHFMIVDKSRQVSNIIMASL